MMITINSIAIQATIFIALSAARWILNHIFSWVARAVAKVTASNRFKPLRSRYFWSFMVEALAFVALIIGVQFYFSGSKPATYDDLRHIYFAVYWTFAIGALATFDYAIWRGEKVKLALTESLAELRQNVANLQLDKES